MSHQKEDVGMDPLDMRDNHPPRTTPSTRPSSAPKPDLVVLKGEAAELFRRLAAAYAAQLGVRSLPHKVTVQLALDRSLAPLVFPVHTP
jgi:hypothetical protein